jgi:arabinose-5-phosphate isomerase
MSQQETSRPEIDPVAEARRILTVEAEGIAAVAAALGDSFAAAVELLAACRGRVIVTGMGKSGLVGQKIAATFSSTGTPALFLHPAEAVHGDLGIVTTDDVMIAISYSGRTPELLDLLPHVKRFGVPLIAITGETDSPLATLADTLLLGRVPKEACPWDIVPTASTTAAMALGDALAVVLLLRRGFRREDFSIFHPGGSLGRRLLFTVADLMHAGGENPVVTETTPLAEAVEAMTRGRLGMVGVVGGDGVCVGIITDGDLRRALQRHDSIAGLTAGEVMTRGPRTIAAGALAAEALRVMEERKITVLLVTDAAGRPVGAIHLHDILKVGIA